MPKIRDVKTFITCPDGINLVVVKVETEDGLYGLGCATFTQRCQAVKTLIDEHLKPLVVGREAAEIQELWNLMNQNAYWRGGPVINNAVSGIDMALWDIKGKMAGMPVYELLGGKCREALTLYRYANGSSREEILERAQRLWEEGYHHIRLQYLPMKGYPQMQRDWQPEGAKSGFYQDPRAYMRETVGLFEYVRGAMGFDPELIHDVHERVSVNEAMQLAKELEPMKLYFLEDLFAPEQAETYKDLKGMCVTPLAYGELCTNVREWREAVASRSIDFLRIHMSMIGGMTPTIKCAHFCELYDVKTAWHGPTDMNPVGFAAQMHLGIASPNFGIQEWPDYGENIGKVFRGMPQMRQGYAYLNTAPGFGVEFDEAAARAFPYRKEVVGWTQFRTTDGSLHKP